MNLSFDHFKSKINSIFQRFLKLSLIKKGLVAILILVTLFAGYKFTIGAKSKTPEYQTAQVEKGTLITSVTASGTVSSANSAEISTQATGIVKEVYVANEDIVSVGQTIAALALDQSSSQKAAAAYASYLSAVNSLNSAKSKMNSLQAALFTANQTFVKGKGSSSDPDTADPTYVIQRANWLQAEADYNNQQGVISAAEASLSSASLSLAQTSATITAPISGTISNLTLTPGLPVSGGNSSSSSTNSTTTTASQSIGNIKLEGAGLQASVSLTEIDVTKVKVGQKVTMVLDAFSDKTFTGKVASIDTNGSVISGVTAYPAVIIFDTAPDNIYPNMAVTATIITDVKDNVLLVPSTAVQIANGQSYVREQRNGVVTQVNVETGESNDTQTEITSGATEGETIIIGTVSNGTTSTSTTSPFGGSGIGGFGGGAGRGGGNATFRRTGQ